MTGHGHHVMRQDDLTSTASQGDKSSVSRDHLPTDSSAVADSSLGRCNHHPPEKVMAPHSSALAWKIPWVEEPGGLQSMASLSRTRLKDFTLTFYFHALEKEMATHSSIFA